MADNSISDISGKAQSPISRYNSGDLGDFLHKLFNNPLPKYATFSFALDLGDPLVYLEKAWDKHAFQFYWEKPDTNFAIAAGNELQTFSASGPDRFQQIQNKVQTAQDYAVEYTSVPHPYSGMMFLGGFSFFDEVKSQLWSNFASASFTIPEWMVIKDGNFNLVSFTVKPAGFATPDQLHRYLVERFTTIRNTLAKPLSRHNTKGATPLADSEASGYEQWVSSVEKAKELIEQKQFEKIVLARRISVAASPSPIMVVDNLRRQYSRCFNFLIHSPEGKTFLGSTPERLGAFRNRLLLTDALAGSIERGQTAAEDRELENNLSDSPKNRKEHSFVVRDVEERLKPFSIMINRNSQPGLKKLSNVQHLYTPIRAQLKQKSHMFEVLGQMHPTPAVGGYPWKNAAPYIKELEDFDRGWYAGPVGWINTKECGDFAVGIRSGLLTGSEAHFFAGCGIVEDSDPAEEWEETNLKLKPMLSAL